MNLRRLYAADAIAMPLLGFLIHFGFVYEAFRHPGADVRVPLSFVRMFGAALIAFGLAAMAVWRAREPQVQTDACKYFFFAHCALFAMAFAQQTAIWGNPAGATMVNVFLLFQGGFGYYWLAAMRQPGLAPGRSLWDLRTEWERRIREAAGQQERNRLARELHDSIKQQLYAIQTHLAAAQARGGDTEPAIEQARASARNAMAEMNAMLDQLRASPLETVGLVEALRSQAEAVHHRTGSEVNTVFGSLPPDNRFPPGVQPEVFRIAQEALANAARHARAANVTVELGSAPPDHLLLRVRDDGQGFAPEAAAEGMGLRNMRSRAASLGAALKIESAPGEGCTVTLRVPLRAAETEEYCRHMRLAGGAFAFSAGLVAFGFGLAEPGYFFPAALGAVAAFYHFTRYLHWKRLAGGGHA